MKNTAPLSALASISSWVEAVNWVACCVPGPFPMSEGGTLAMDAARLSCNCSERLFRTFGLFASGDVPAQEARRRDAVMSMKGLNKLMPDLIT